MRKEKIPVRHSGELSYVAGIRSFHRMKQWTLGFLVWALLANASRLVGAEALPLELVETAVVPPPPPLVAGSMPRDSVLPLLLVRFEERGQAFDDPEVTSFALFDPAKPGDGLREIFRGPGNEQFLSPVTGLFGGWGLTQVQLNPKGSPEDDERWRWFHFPSGTLGPSAGTSFYVRERREGWLWGESGRAGEGQVLVRFHPATGVRQQVRLVFTRLDWLPGGRVIAGG